MKISPQLIFIVSIWLLPNPSYAQNSLLDSLNEVTPSLKEDSVLVDHLLRLAIAQSNVDNTLSMSTSWRAKKLAQSIGYLAGEANAYNRLSYNYQIAGKSDSAKLITQEGYDFSTTNEQLKYKAEAAYLLGGLYSDASNTERALNFYQQALETAEILGDSKTKINSYNGLGIMMMGARDMEKSAEYLKEGLKIALEENFENLATRQYINLSIAIDSIEESSYYLDKAIDLAEKNNNFRALSYAYNFKGDLLMKTNQNEEALIIVKKAFALAKNVGDIDKVKRTNLDLGELFHATGEIDSSRFYYSQYLKDTLTEVYTHGTVKALKGLGDLNAGAKNYEDAYYHLDSAFHVAQRNYEKTIEENINESNTKYESEKKDAELARNELELAKSENLRNKVIGGSLLALLFASGIFFWYYERQKSKKKTAELQLQQERIEARRLKEIDEMKTQFFTNVSHELRTPLTLILGPLKDVLEKSENPSTKKSVHLAYNNADRLLDMVNEVLDLSKLESGGINLSPTIIELKAFLNRVTFAFESMAEIRDIDLSLSLHFDQEYVNIDHDKLEKILNNLISNAIKYSYNGSSVEVQADIQNENLLLSVVDHGKGILPEEQDKIFNRFYQSSIITTVEGGGTGVGLALSKELAELFGGSLTVHSEVDKGSTFTLNIPVHKVSGPQELSDSLDVAIVENKSYKPILINGQKPHVLIVEDNDEMRQYLNDILESEYRCSFAKDGYAALQKIQTQNFDVITSDIMMPNMDGFELKKKVNKLHSKNRVPFIFLSARSLEEDIVTGLQLGVDDYITKPFNRYEYMARIQNLIKNKIERDAAISTETLSEINTESVEQELLKKAELTVLKNISNVDFTVPDLADQLNYSQRQLSRILKKATGMTPVNFILELRLQRAYYLLKSKKYHTINEVMYEVGIGSSSYFARKFKERFGINASEI